MYEPRSRVNERFEREEAQRRYYIQQQRSPRARRNGFDFRQKWNTDSPKSERNIRSYSNPDVTGFYVQNSSNRRASEYVHVEQEFEEGLSEGEIKMFDSKSNGDGTLSYISAKNKIIARNKNAYYYHEPLKPKRSRSFGDIQNLNDYSIIYDHEKQLNQKMLFGLRRYDENGIDPRNSLGNTSTDSGQGSRPSSPMSSSLGEYDHLLPNAYSRNRRPSHQVPLYHPYDHISPRKVSEPVSTKQKPKMSPFPEKKALNSKNKRRVSHPVSYEEVALTQPRAYAVDDGTHNKEALPLGSRDGNWMMRKKRISMDGEEIAQVDESSVVTPPQTPRPKLSIPPRVPPRDTIPALSTAKSTGELSLKSPNHSKQDSTASQGSGNHDYDNPVDVFDGVPSIMIHPHNPENLPKNELSIEQNFGFQPVNGGKNGMESYLTDDNENEIQRRRLSTFYEESLPKDFDENGIYPPPSIAETSISRNTLNSNYTDIDLTVDKRPNQESEVREDGEEICTNIYVVTMKWIAVILVALTVLFCVTANKICLLVIGHEYSLLTDNATIWEAKKKDNVDRLKLSSKESIVIMLVMIIMAPHAISLIYGLWGKRRSQKWPKKTAILWIILGGSIEAFCISFLCLYVLTVLSIEPIFFLLFISGLFVIPTIIQICESARRWETKKGKMRIVTFTIAAGMQISGLIMLIYTKKEMIELKAKIAVPLTIALLSIVWSPKMRKLQTKPFKPLDPVVESPTTRHSSSENLPFQQDEDGISVFPNGTLDRDSAPLKPKKQAAREKAAIVMSVVHLIMTPVVSFVICEIFEIAKLENLSEGFSLLSANHPAFYFFITQILVTFIGFHMAWLACSMYAQRPAFALPLTLATPIALILIEVRGSCDNYSFIPLQCSPHKGEQLYYVLAVAILMLTGQFLSTGYYVWANMGYIMGKASHLFWLPSYTGVLLEPFLLLNRRNKVTDDRHVASKCLARDTYVFICTTMYHEVLEEMEQLLSSLHDIDVNFKKGGRHVESHIFFDGCIKAEVMNSWILQLASVVEYTLKVKLSDVTKIITPYGMQLKWALPGGLPITIHLKDNTKVKNKKRWSQVMYMSYVLDYKQRQLKVRDDQTFILTTDADVKFTHESMEALLDYMVQDDQIGAVCGRTHPLGNGPMVWYQIFDYAIGHWFMKVANHVFGSVLCCPGCFSLYRCQAVRDILPTYSTTVSEAFEFLTKDMGEDRWMCTLMVQAGWRLAYCAAAEDETFCPQEFEEFYKQRRRWMPSTLANLGLLVSEWRVVLKNNENISFPFILYQVVLLCATLIGPSIVILFITGGLVNMGMNEILAVVLLSGTTVGYGAICYFFPQSTQITIAKLFTFIFAVIMIVVTIGLALQIKVELDEREDLKEANRKSNYTLTIPIDKRLPAGISTLYLAGLSGVFIVAALMHPKEALCLLNGMWYLLCLPSGYLLLTIYSVVNMTDRSWGTREGKKGNKEVSPIDILWKNIKSKCVCCFKQSNPDIQTKPAEDSKSKLKRGISKKLSKKITLSKTNSRCESEVASVVSSSVHSIREKNRLAQGSIGRFKQAFRQSLNSIGFFRNDQKEMEDPSFMQYGGQSGRMPEMFGTLQNRPQESPFSGRYLQGNYLQGDHLQRDHLQGNHLQGNHLQGNHLQGNHLQGNHLQGDHLQGDHLQGNHLQGNHLPGNSNEGYEMNTLPLPALPFHPFIKQNIHDNEAYEDDTIQPPPTPKGSDKDDTPTTQKNNSPIYDEIPSLQKPQYLTPAPSELRNPSIERVKMMDTLVEHDSDYSSFGSSNPPPGRRRRPSRGDLLQPNRHNLNILDVDNLNMDSISTMGSMNSAFGGDASFALLTSDDIYLPVEDWLKGDLREYIPNFKKHGYDSIAFISSMSEKDLENIGIEKRGHRQKFFREVKRLPKHEIEEDIPDDVLEWLDDLGLADYQEAFEENGYTEPSDLEDLKSMDKDTVKETFHIKKIAHLNMLCTAIQKLQYANTGQKKIRNARRELLRVPTHLLEHYNNDNGEEYDFWENLRQACLTPELAGFDGNTEIKEKLQELRNSSVMVFFVANALWLIVIIVLVRQSELKAFGVDVIGLSFLLVYGTIIILQFLAMIGHRFTTLIHILARASWLCCRPSNNPEINQKNS